VRFLVDAQLPRRLARLLAAAGHDALHTLELADANRTTDDQINVHSARDGRIVVTKDSDFVTTFWLNRVPPKLLLVSTGNIANDDLCALVSKNLPRLEVLLAQHHFIELSKTNITIHA